MKELIKIKFEFASIKIKSNYAAAASQGRSKYFKVMSVCVPDDSEPMYKAIIMIPSPTVWNDFLVRLAR
jgi:hypothetical protein